MANIMAEALSFKQALSVLSISSPYSVATERAASISQGLDDIKKYLYIETDIEQDFKKELTSLTNGQPKIIFLCGSSGDGKSEILTRYSQEFSGRAKFHLDATHSFKPHDSAIDTLNTVFNTYNNQADPLVIGINVGMLGNYAQEGSDEVVKASIKAFLSGNKTPDDHVYLDFENYPKFKLERNGHTSKFAKDLLQRITAQDDNILRQYFDKELLRDDCEKQLCANYELLSIDAVQDVIIDLLFKARLVKDQFLTARALLGFVHHLIAGNGYLFDNLFTPDENELSAKIAEFDPSNIRSKITDDFVLSHSLKLPNEQLGLYKAALKEINITVDNDTPACSILRLLYLLRMSDFSNKYHQKFADVFNEELVEQYSNIWHLHQNFDDSSEERAAIRNFYRTIVFTAVHKYNNRNAVGTEKDDFFLSMHNKYSLVAQLEIKANISEIKKDTSDNVSHFNAYFKVEDQTITLPININLLNLMQRIVLGYRPNKHDKSTVIMLDETVAKIAQIANKSKTLHVISKDNRFKIKNNNDEETLEVSGI